MRRLDQSPKTSIRPSEPVQPDLAKFRNLEKLLTFFNKFLTVYLVCGKILNILWPNEIAPGQIFIGVKGQNWKIMYPSGHTD